MVSENACSSWTWNSNYCTSKNAFVVTDFIWFPSLLTQRSWFQKIGFRRENWSCCELGEKSLVHARLVFLHWKTIIDLLFKSPGLTISPQDFPGHTAIEPPDVEIFPAKISGEQDVMAPRHSGNLAGPTVRLHALHVRQNWNYYPKLIPNVAMKLSTAEFPEVLIF